MRSTLSKLSGTAKVMPLVVLVAFFGSVTSESRSTRNGEVVSCSYTDFLALGVAAACLIAGGVLLRRGLRPSDVVERQVATWHIAIGAGLIAFAAVHALRGIGAIGGTCP